ncbi:type VI secretion system-associated protein TagF [Pseudoalteromonas denitrificans]|uniref:Type VI secretion-associated protein, BMA_A0400 family n=1 Tax=Pseudoalteromonas denitrificans DSM 6059 TaxID=1123010 RepID=A0A1I1NE43_9GAMM|nr:type VI secretion system-associated protein TagF [Pseudoalteromonas denitrificans]SFC95656.1 type VI secretion-associated protein, BMA_A0400 family [Pseudoalteromonas denitrificans DSM 6059]
MFGLFKRKEENQIKQHKFDFGFLGKTKLRPDFIKLNVNFREAVALDHWVQEGFAHVSRDQLSLNKSQINLSASLFFMSGNEDDSALLGVIQPSEDSSGRKYPFSSFVTCGQTVYKAHPACLFLSASQAIEHFLATTYQVFSGVNVKEMEQNATALNQVATALKVPVEPHFLIESFRKIPMSEFWQAIGLSDIQARASLIEESSLLLKSMANRGCLRTQFGLKLPMPFFSHEGVVIGAFWLHLITMIVADHNWQPWFFYNLGDEQSAPSITIFTRPVPASYFSSIWLSNSKISGVIDLQNLIATKTASEQSVALAELDNMSMFDALRKWCKPI